jgi:ketosteroid isomerase-like protein
MTYEETEAVRSIVASVAHHIDAKNWSDLQALYASEVETDYTSLFGGTPQSQTSEALIAGWRGILANVRTQHLLGPITVTSTGATATAHCHVRALHQVSKAPGGEDWEVLGHYVFELARQAPGWRIRRMKLETFAQTGNPNLLTEATK